MKVREGYVSNSSSSSFVTDPREIAKLLRAERREKILKLNEIIEKEREKEKI